MKMTNGQKKRLDFQIRTSSTSLLDGHSIAIRNVSKLIHLVADSNTTVLIQGESGTGKELVARSVHISSPRRAHYFVPVNCAAIPKDLLESELFGHKKGAFSGAITDHKGRFELAHHGTLFLDEIGDMDLNMQAKLLRVLQEKIIERVGSIKSIEVDVRIIAATHRNLEEMVEKGEFREDLFYRLNVFPINIPPLRRRAEDLPTLVGAITEKIKKESQREIVVKPEAMQTLMQYMWPGNVRELSNLLERLSILYPNREISLQQLPEKYQHSTPKVLIEKNIEPDNITPILLDSRDVFDYLPPLTHEGIDLKIKLIELELHYIRQALKQAEGVISKAANLLGLRRTTLVEKLKRHNLAVPETI